MIKIISSLQKKYNAFSNDHVYITFKGKFGVLEFDVNDNEYFLELDSFHEMNNGRLTNLKQIYLTYVKVVTITWTLFD